MITKLAYNWLTDIDYEALEFDPDAVELLPDRMLQFPIFVEMFHVLDAHLNTMGPPEEIFRGGSSFICYDRSNLNVRVSPDFYVAFGVDAATITQRRLYLPWEVGKPPDLALEVGSESTAGEDTGRKRDIYAQIGVGEYWLFDPTGGDLYGEPLLGLELVGGSYQRLDTTYAPDGVLKAYSRLLGISLCWQEGRLTFYNPQTGNYLMNYTETETALRAERRARQQAEARLLELEEELRRRS